MVEARAFLRKVLLDVELSRVFIRHPGIGRIIAEQTTPAGVNNFAGTEFDTISAGLSLIGFY
jgi:hypothetical protein